MPPKFGTSGLRGLVTDLTDELVASYVRAFVQSCPTGESVFVARDLRDSSPRIAQAALEAVQASGRNAVDCGALLTPALALASMDAQSSAIMVTGSHIPADRNGIKFYTPDGEITKTHEASILAALETSDETVAREGTIAQFDGEPAYLDRYLQAFGNEALKGKRIGVYSHSTVGRDILASVLTALGAETTELGRSNDFIPVDTEAVAADVRSQLIVWSKQHSFDSIVSMDGDGDRPLLTDEKGNVIVGDILGQITAAFLNAKNVVTPVSSNTGVELGAFENVRRTRIGSPYVIAGMEELDGDVVGYEANGGFLLGFKAEGPKGPIPSLMTRDSVLPMVCVLAASGGDGISSLIQNQPPRFTAADRLQEVPTKRSKALVEQLTLDPSPLLDMINGTFVANDLTDGLRITLQDGRIVHLRPSGNAPELRLYIEAETMDLALSTLEDGLSALRSLVA